MIEKPLSRLISNHSFSPKSFTNTFWSRRKQEPFQGKQTLILRTVAAKQIYRAGSFRSSLNFYRNSYRSFFSLFLTKRQKPPLKCHQDDRRFNYLDFFLGHFNKTILKFNSLMLSSILQVVPAKIFSFHC